jgi:hypothetical protein
MAWIATMLVGGAWWVRRDVAAYARAVASRSRHGLARGLVGCLAAGLRTGARPLRLGGGARDHSRRHIVDRLLSPSWIAAASHDRSRGHRYNSLFFIRPAIAD